MNRPAQVVPQVPSQLLPEPLSAPPVLQAPSPPLVDPHAHLAPLARIPPPLSPPLLPPSSPPLSLPPLPLSLFTLIDIKMVRSRSRCMHALPRRHLHPLHRCHPPFDLHVIYFVEFFLLLLNRNSNKNYHPHTK